MGFFDVLNRALGHRPPAPARDQARLADAWGVAATPDAPVVAASAAAELEPPPEPPDYDRLQWRKKLKRILEHLPASQGEWDSLLTEARALNFEYEWVMRTQIEEFALLMRRAVADCHVTPAEHRKLDLARSLIDIPEPEAEAMLKAIIQEAEAFFGHSVQES